MGPFSFCSSIWQKGRAVLWVHHSQTDSAYAVNLQERIFYSSKKHAGLKWLEAATISSAKAPVYLGTALFKKKKKISVSFEVEMEFSIIPECEAYLEMERVHWLIHMLLFPRCRCQTSYYTQTNPGGEIKLYWTTEAADGCKRKHKNQCQDNSKTLSSTQDWGS